MRNAHHAPGRLPASLPSLRWLAATRGARYVGAAAIMLTGADHLEQYYRDHYSVIPTIGTLFLLNFASSALVALMLLAPLERLGRRLGEWLLVLAALGGIGIAGGSLAGLIVSETTGLFGFMESGFREAIALSVVFETITLITLLGYAIATAIRLGARPDDRTRSH